MQADTREGGKGGKGGRACVSIVPGLPFLPSFFAFPSRLRLPDQVITVDSPSIEHPTSRSPAHRSLKRCCASRSRGRRLPLRKNTTPFSPTSHARMGLTGLLPTPLHLESPAPLPRPCTCSQPDLCRRERGCIASSWAPQKKRSPWRLQLPRARTLAAAVATTCSTRCDEVGKLYLELVVVP